MQPRTEKKWMARALDTITPWAERDIISFRRACRDSTELISAFQDAVDSAGGVPITPEQNEKGRTYLLSRSLRKDGTERVGCRLTDFDLGILRAFSHHMFVDLYNIGRVRPHYLPVYRAISTSGEWFEYVGFMYEHVTVLDRSGPMQSRTQSVGGTK